jgi:hypothetical protein
MPTTAAPGLVYCWTASVGRPQGRRRPRTAAAGGRPQAGLDEDEDVTLIARWGTQLDVRHITADDGGELSAEQVAGYVAKYATKGIEALGVTLDHRVCEVEL